MRIEYHNVKNGLDRERIFKETIVLENVTLEDYYNCLKVNDHVKLMNDEGFLIREFTRWENDIRFDYPSDNKDVSSNEVFKWAKKDGIRHEKTYLDTYDGYIGNYGFTNTSCGWYITGKKMNNDRVIITVIDGKIKYMLKKSYKYVVNNNWFDVDTWDRDAPSCDKNYCKKVLNDVKSKINKMDIDEDLKIFLYDIMTEKECE